MENEILLIPEKEDLERSALADAWKNAGGTVERIGKFWEKPTLHNNAKLTIYGNDTFALVLAQVLSVELVSPKDELIAKLETKWTKRKIDLNKIDDLASLSYPYFIKPVKPKLFVSAIYPNLGAIRNNTKELNGDEVIICSEIIAIDCEVRVFILHGQICDLAVYEGEADLNEAQLFISDFLSEQPDLPEAYVLDIGYNSVNGWFIIEFNAAWGAGLNGCRPEKVMDCIKAATIN